MGLVALLLLGLWCAGGVLLFRGLAREVVARDRETAPAARAVLAEAGETLRREAAILARDPAVVEGAVKGDWATLARGASPRLTALTIDRVADILLIVDATGAPLVQVPATP
ncbi:MAG: hypothetical protein HY216_12360, partial [Candidatus Rokubacteria bacterium]|nr:hypothetical protein [Candidatus Rokubacteria bacterium]